MNISIRKSKHQKTPMTDGQFNLACKCIAEYKLNNRKTYWIFSGTVFHEKVGCDVYKTKTQISAVVYHG
jgi:hypothetical protein